MSGKDMIFGKRAVNEALRAGVPITRLYVAKGLKKDKSASNIIDKAKSEDIQVIAADTRKLDSMVEGLGGGAHQGVVAEATPFRYASMRDILDRAYENGLVVVCDHITDAGNLGAIIRSAESAGACGVVIANKRCAQVTPVTYKTSAGALAYIPVAQVPNLSRSLQELKDGGFWVVAATEKADDLLWETDMKGRVALVVGNEHDGISDLLLKTCDLSCKLPQMGALSSLNAAQASTVFMYEWLRQNERR